MTVVRVMTVEVYGIVTRSFEVGPVVPVARVAKIHELALVPPSGVSRIVPLARRGEEEAVAEADEVVSLEVVIPSVLPSVVMVGIPHRERIAISGVAGGGERNSQELWNGVS